MKRRSLLLLLGLVALSSITANADVFVQGYHRAKGTHAKPHNRSDPNGNFNDHWSTKENQNPYKRAT